MSERLRVVVATPLIPELCDLLVEREAGLVRVLTEVRDWVSEKLENTTIADVC